MCIYLFQVTEISSKLIMKVAFIFQCMCFTISGYNCHVINIITMINYVVCNVTDAISQLKEF